MPLNKKKKSYKGYIFAIILIAIIILMIISFAPVQHINEVVLFS